MVIKTADSLFWHKTQAPPHASFVDLEQISLSFLRLSFFIYKMKLTGTHGAVWGLPGILPSVKRLANNERIISVFVVAVVTSKRQLTFQ